MNDRNQDMKTKSVVISGVDIAGLGVTHKMVHLIYGT